MSKNNSFEVTGQLEHFTDELFNALVDWCDKNKYEYATILHDKDLKHNEETNQDELVKVHRHFIVNTKSSRWTFQMLLQRFEAKGLKNTMIQNVKRGWNNALSYLCHRTDKARQEGKHLYELSEVQSNFDYIKTIEIIENQVEEKKTVIGDVIEKIKSGECRRYNIFEYISMDDYIKRGNKQQIDLAFQYKETQLKSELKERKMKVYWICGKSGIGKSTLSRMLCKGLNYSYAVSSSSNDPLQDYDGQDVLILDDFRPNNWSKSDVLKMLDNKTMSSIKSRYQNKQTCYLKAVIVTSIQTPYDFWIGQGWEKSGNEPYEQLRRRINYQVEMYQDEDDGHIYYTVSEHKQNGEVKQYKYDYTEQYEEMKDEVEKEDEPIAFSKLKHERKIETSQTMLKLDDTGKFVTDKDVPF